MRILVSLRHGSHLYGTSTPQSDTDVKRVHVPTAREIVLGAVSSVVEDKRPKAEGERNVPTDVDVSSFSLRRFFSLLRDGQTVALEMLFAPESAWEFPPLSVWHEILRRRDRLVSRRSSAFLAYCRQQANKYGIKGSRVAAARGALFVLADLYRLHGAEERLGVAAAELALFAEAHEHVEVEHIKQASGEHTPHLAVCGRRMPYSASIDSAYVVVNRIVNAYGARALEAERNAGVDWKALSHAVRVGTQALELLSSGHLTFPRPDAAHLLRIKMGELPYLVVAEELERLLAEVTEAEACSPLPAEPDSEWMEDFLASVYAEEVRRSAVTSRLSW